MDIVVLHDILVRKTALDIIYNRIASKENQERAMYILCHFMGDDRNMGLQGTPGYERRLYDIASNPNTPREVLTAILEIAFSPYKSQNLGLDYSVVYQICKNPSTDFLQIVMLMYALEKTDQRSNMKWPGTWKMLAENPVLPLLLLEDGSWFSKLPRCVFEEWMDNPRFRELYLGTPIRVLKWDENAWLHYHLSPRRQRPLNQSFDPVSVPKLEWFVEYSSGFVGVKVLYSNQHYSLHAATYTFRSLEEAIQYGRDGRGVAPACKELVNLDELSGYAIYAGKAIPEGVFFYRR